MKNLTTLKDFAARLAAMKAEAGRLGLLKTMHAMNAATDKVGWEIAEQIQKADKPRKL